MATNDLDLGERIQRLEDAQAAQATLRGYVDSMDAQDLSKIPELFTSDAVLEVPGARFEGVDAILGFYTQAFADDPTVKVHFHTNLAITAHGGGRVDIRSYLLYFASGVDTSIIGWGSYDDEFRIEDGVAKYCFKRIGITRVVDSREGWPAEVTP